MARGKRRSDVVSLSHLAAVGEHRAQLINLAIEREARQELDLQCRDCGRVCSSLPELVGHYDTLCRNRRHPSAGLR